jgi:hypothetical protein
MAETIEEGNDLISKVNRLREEVERRDFNCGKKTDLVEDETANDRLTLLAEQLVHRPHQKSSFLRLKCLLNKTEDKINTLTNQIKSR